MPLIADRHDYRDAFRKHIESAKKLSADHNKYSLNLLLSYCVECGLKYKIMEKNGIWNTKEAIEDIQKVLREHDFEKLLHALNVGEYKFSHFCNVHNETVTAKNYHEFCRYALRTNDESEFLNYENTLRKIIEWLKEEV